MAHGDIPGAKALVLCTLAMVVVRRGEVGAFGVVDTCVGECRKVYGGESEVGVLV